MRVFFVIFSLSSLLAACGQTGALYLPEDAAPKPPTVQPQNTQPQPAKTTP